MIKLKFLAFVEGEVLVPIGGVGGANRTTWVRSALLNNAAKVTSVTVKTEDIETVRG